MYPTMDMPLATRILGGKQLRPLFLPQLDRSSESSLHAASTQIKGSLFRYRTLRKFLLQDPGTILVHGP